MKKNITIVSFVRIAKSAFSVAAAVQELSAIEDKIMCELKKNERKNKTK
jgi:hypothetical protein